MTQVKIETKGGFGVVMIDGQKVPAVTHFGVEMACAGVPKLTLGLCVPEQSLDLSGASVRIDRLEMPEEVEKALLQFLCKKYPMTSSFHRVFDGLPVDTYSFP